MYNTAPHYRPALPTRPRRRTLLGVSLVELLISLALGLIVLAGATALFVGTIRSNAQLAGSVDLNQDISSSMTLITNELRRAGFGREGTWENHDPEARINIVEPASGDTFESCLLFAYDRNDNLAIDNNEWRGFQLDQNNLWMRTSCNPVNVACETSCARDPNHNVWQRMLPEHIEITNFSIDTEGSKCTHAGTGSVWHVTEAGSVRFPCRQWANSSGTPSIEGMALYTLNTEGRHQLVGNNPQLPDHCVVDTDDAEINSIPDLTSFINSVLESTRLNITLVAQTEQGGITQRKELNTSIKIRNQQIFEPPVDPFSACTPPTSNTDSVGQAVYETCITTAISSSSRSYCN